MTRPVDAIPPCPCPPCRAFDAALDAHLVAIAAGRDVEETRNAVHLAAAQTDRAHGLDRPIRRRSDVTP